MVFCRYPWYLQPGQESIGFMNREQCLEYWQNEDFAPIVDTRVINDETGNPQEKEYRFTHRRITRAGSPSMSFKIRGPLGPLSYNHQPLSQPQAQIRIVTLLPGAGLEPLRCSMSTHNFPSGAGKYTCLSYVWGTPKGTYPMYLDSGIIGITENLMAALWHIRRKRKPIRLWIDALCINQVDEEEKAHQVQMMGTVFERADRLISWLGSSQSETAEISQDLNRLFQASLNWRKDQESRRRLVKAFTKVNWINLRPVFDSAYWSRAWIVQEVAVREEYRALYPLFKEMLDRSQYPLSRRQAQWPKIRGCTADYLLYGQCKISLWCILVVSEAIYWSQSDTNARGMYRPLPNTGSFNETLFSLPKGLFWSVTAPSSLQVTSQLEFASSKTFPFAFAYTQSCASLQVGQDRDRLFSLAGLYKNLGIVVDYDKPDTEVVLDIAQYVVTSLQAPRRLFFVPPPENHGLRPVPEGLPAADTLVSWVEYGKTILFPHKVYHDYFTRLQNSQFTGTRTDTLKNTIFRRGPGWGKLYARCMYRAKVVKLFQEDDNKELRKAMAARFGGNQMDYKEIDFLLRCLGFQPSSGTDHNEFLDCYSDVDRYKDDDVDHRLVMALCDMRRGSHHVGILSDGNLFVSCSYSQIGDEVILAEGFLSTFVVRNATPQGEVQFVERAALVGISQSQVITEWREELVIV